MTQQLIDKIADHCLSFYSPEETKPIDKDLISSFEVLLNAVIQSHSDILLTVKELKTLRAFVVQNIQPNVLSLDMTDFVTDLGMWEWVAQFDSKYISNNDFEAQRWAIFSLKEMMDNNNIWKLNDEN